MTPASLRPSAITPWWRNRRVVPIAVQAAVGVVVLVIVAVTAVLNALFPDGPVVGDFATAISLVTLAVPFVYFAALFRRRDLGGIQ